MSSYTPFENDIGSLTANDLSVLRDTPEGWYIEYKRECTSNVANIAKSISAFANSYGGWIFYGIDEAEIKSGVARGIDRGAIPAAEQQIQRAVSAHVTPTPYFKKQILLGPEPTIGLEEGKGLIILHVPMGNNAPYLHSTGRIYRRVADASDPTHETDRYFLDLLWKRGKEYRESFSDFVKKEPELSKAEDGLSYIKLCFFPDPWNEKGIYAQISFEQFFELMQNSDVETGGLPFDNIYTTNYGFIARHVYNNKFNGQVLTWRFWRDGISEVTIPLNTIEFGNLAIMARSLHGYETTSDFLKTCQARNIQSGQLIDLSQLFVILCSILKRKRKILQLCDLESPIFAKAMMRGIWRKIPFLDLPEVKNFYRERGVPVILQDECFSPMGSFPEDCLLLDGKIETAEDIEPQAQLEVSSWLDASRLMAAIGNSLGIYTAPIFETDIFDKLTKLGERARKVTAMRTALEQDRN